MSKKFEFSTGSSIELGADGLITRTYEANRFTFGEIESVFIKKPGFLSKGYVNINDEYVSFKKKDMSLVLELVSYLEKLGVIVAMYRGKSSQTYLENCVTVGGSCSFYKFVDGELVYYYFGKVYKVNYDQIKCILVSKKLVVFATDNTSLFSGVVIDEKEDLKAEITIRPSDFVSAVAFAKKVKEHAEHVEIKVIA